MLGAEVSFEIHETAAFRTAGIRQSEELAGGLADHETAGGFLVGDGGSTFDDCRSFLYGSAGGVGSHFGEWGQIGLAADKRPPCPVLARRAGIMGFVCAHGA